MGAQYNTLYVSILVSLITCALFLFQWDLLPCLLHLDQIVFANFSYIFYRPAT